MLRYQEDNELHKDFHGSTDLMLSYLAENFGEETMKEFLADSARKIYKSIYEKMKAGDNSELIEHLTWFFRRENGEFKLEYTEDEIRFEVTRCPAWHHVKKHSKWFCAQTTEVNKGLCSETPFETSTKILGPGHCMQIFKKKDKKNDSK
jgi:predicted ArsR family transcriptional regulator